MRTSNKWKSGLTLLALLLSVIGILSLRPMNAQTVYGSIYGTVLDATGAVVPNATVLVKSQQKETSFKCADKFLRRIPDRPSGSGYL